VLILTPARPLVCVNLSHGISNCPRNFKLPKKSSRDTNGRMHHHMAQSDWQEWTVATVRTTISERAQRGSAQARCVHDSRPGQVNGETGACGGARDDSAKAKERVATPPIGSALIRVMVTTTISRRG